MSLSFSPSLRALASRALAHRALVVLALGGIAASACARSGGAGDIAILPSSDGGAARGATTTGADSPSASSSALASSAPSGSGQAPLASTDDAGDDGNTGDAAADNGNEPQTGDDGGDDASPGSPSSGAAATAPSPGDLAITEVMLEPSQGEPASEWFEVYNTTATPKSLFGLTIEDGYLDTHVIDSTAAVVSPFAYAILARSRVAALDTLVPSAAILYEYGAGPKVGDDGIELDTGDAGDLSLWSGDALLVDVPYGMWDAAYVGQSIELASPGLTSTDPSNWCLAENPWASGSDDGTPGAASDCSP